MASSILSKQTPEEEIAKETMVMHERAFHEKLDEMDEITNEIAFRIHSYYQVFSAFGDVVIQIDSLQYSLEAMRAVLKDTKHPSLNRFKKDKTGDDVYVVARNELYAEELRKMKRAIGKIEKMLPDLEGYDDFKMGSRNVYKKLDQDKHAISEMEKLIEDPEYVPKKSIITMEMERQQRKEQIYNKKTIVKPAAASVSSPVQEDPMEKFATLMNELEEKKVPATETLGNLEKLFNNNPKFTPSDDDLENMFNHLGKILERKDTKAISKTLSLLKYFTKNKKYHSLIFKTDILKQIAPLLHTTDDPIIESTLENFVYIAENTNGMKAIIESKVLKFMLKVFEIEDEEFSYQSLQLLSKFSEGGEEAIKEIFKQDKNLFYFMVNHLDADHRPSRLPAFNCVINTLAHANEELTHGMIDMGCVCDLCNFFYEYSGKFAMDAFEALKNTLEKSGSRAKDVANSMKGCGGIDYLMEMNTKESKAIIDKFFDD